MSKLDSIRSILSARGAKNAAELPQLATGAPLLTPSPIKGLINLTCRDPFISDPESWDCSCHEIMSEKCEIKDCGKGKDCFTSCYKTQLCNDPKVCHEWKQKVCTDIKDCKDNDNALNNALNKAFKTGPQRRTCADLVFDCRHEEIGALVRHHCPKTCGKCNLYPYKQQHKAKAGAASSLELDTGSSFGDVTLTPRPPIWTPTPTRDNSCFVDPDAFDCSCYGTKQDSCRNEDSRRSFGLRHNNGRVYSTSECEQFFVCTHSQTCKSYKDMHCQEEMALHNKLQQKGHQVPTC